MEAIERNLFRFKIPTSLGVGSTNVYFLAGKIPTLIDTGIKMPKAWEHLEGGINRLGYGVKDIQQVLLTHGHVEHYGLAEKVHKISSASIVLHPKEWEAIQTSHSPATKRELALDAQLKEWGIPARQRTRIHRLKQKLRTLGGVSQGAISLVDDGTIIQAGDYKLVAIHCPGYSPGHLAWHLQDKQVVFSGDLAALRATPFPGLYLPPENLIHNGLADYSESLSKIAKLNVQRFYPAHGPEIINLSVNIDRINQAHTKQKERFLELLGNSDLSLYELANDLLGDASKKRNAYTFWLAVRETLAHLILLQQEGTVINKREEGHGVFSLVRKISGV